MLKRAMMMHSDPQSPRTLETRVEAALSLRLSTICEAAKKAPDRADSGDETTVDAMHPGSDEGGDHEEQRRRRRTRRCSTILRAAQ
jgi:hypothetical protein